MVTSTPLASPRNCSRLTGHTVLDANAITQLQRPAGHRRPGGRTTPGRKLRRGTSATRAKLSRADQNLANAARSHHAGARVPGDLSHTPRSFGQGPPALIPRPHRL